MGDNQMECRPSPAWPPSSLERRKRLSRSFENPALQKDLQARLERTSETLADLKERTMKKVLAKRKLTISRETLGNLNLEKVTAGQRMSVTLCATNCAWCP